MLSGTADDECDYGWRSNCFEFAVAGRGVSTMLPESSGLNSGYPNGGPPGPEDSDSCDNDAIWVYGRLSDQPKALTIRGEAGHLVSVA